MYITRILPFADLERDITMKQIIRKYGLVPVTERVINSSVYDQIVLYSGPYHDALVLKHDTAATYHNKVSATKPKVAYVRELVVDFVHCFNMGVNRTINPLFAAGDRAFYDLDIAKGNLPKLDKEEEIMTFAGTLIDGDARRMAVVGANPMIFPTIAEIITAKANAQTCIDEESTAKDAFGRASTALKLMNPIVDPWIKQVADSAETFNSQLPDSTKRERCIEWGNKYISVGSGSVLTFHVLDFTTHAAINLMEGQVNQNGDSDLSDETGTLILKTTVLGPSLINFSKIDTSTGLEMYEPYAFETTIVDKSTVEYTVYVTRRL